MRTAVELVNDAHGLLARVAGSLTPTQMHLAREIDNLMAEIEEFQRAEHARRCPQFEAMRRAVQADEAALRELVAQGQTVLPAGDRNAV